MKSKISPHCQIKNIAHIKPQNTQMQVETSQNSNFYQW